jgi:hypothetical protein
LESRHLIRRSRCRAYYDTLVQRSPDILGNALCFRGTRYKKVANVLVSIGSNGWEETLRDLTEEFGPKPEPAPAEDLMCTALHVYRLDSAIWKEA